LSAGGKAVFENKKAALSQGKAPKRSQEDWKKGGKGGGGGAAEANSSTLGRTVVSERVLEKKEQVVFGKKGENPKLGSEKITGEGGLQRRWRENAEFAGKREHVKSS